MHKKQKSQLETFFHEESRPLPIGSPHEYNQPKETDFVKKVNG
ncbi:hypothetical protein [Oceanobacillus senegalensis]|nr:hypothetical protein [Oceanobacillus senegalensis]